MFLDVKKLLKKRENIHVWEQDWLIYMLKSACGFDSSDGHFEIKLTVPLTKDTIWNLAYMYMYSS